MVTNMDDAVKEIDSFYDNQEMCNLFGQIPLRRVSGQLMFSFDGAHQYISLYRQQRSTQPKMSLSHYYTALTFGNTKNHNKIKQKFGDNDHTTFDMTTRMEEKIYAESEQALDYYYFLKLVPHVFIDETTSDMYTSYSYSLNHNGKVS